MQSEIEKIDPMDLIKKTFKRCLSGNLINTVKELKESNFSILLGIESRSLKVPPQLKNSDKELLYFFYSPDENVLLELCVEIEQFHIIPSLRSIWEIADNFEKDVYERAGVEFRGREDFPLREDLADFEKVKVGDGLYFPFSFSVNQQRRTAEIEEWNFNYLKEHIPQLTFDMAHRIKNQRVVDSRYYLGRGTFSVEKSFKKLVPDEAVSHCYSITERNLFHSQILMAKYYEDILSIKVPEKAQLIRMVLMELERIVSHSEALKDTLESIRFDDIIKLRTLLARAYKLRQALVGNFGGDYLRIGGVSSGLSEMWVVEALKFCTHYSLEMTSLYKLVTSSAKAHKYLKSAYFSGKQAISWGLTGPSLRASGVNLDLRKKQGPYFYDLLEFEVPVGLYGSSYDRVLVLMLETIESCKIISQLLDNIPEDHYLAEECDFTHLESTQAYLDRFDQLKFSRQKEYGLDLLEASNGVLRQLKTVDENLRLEDFSFYSSDVNALFSYSKSIIGEDACIAFTAYSSMEIDQSGLVK